MKISAQEEYGLRCLLRLARAQGEHDHPTISEIAAAEKLSVPYVAKLLGVMRQAGLIESVRGRVGGYRLTRAPEETRLGSIMLALGEPLFDDPGYCERHAGTEKGSICVHHDGCTLRGLWQTLGEWVRRLMDRITLADLLESEGHIADMVRARLAETVRITDLPMVSLATVSDD
jgi:Rrf2 family protein